MWVSDGKTKRAVVWRRNAIRGVIARAISFLDKSIDSSYLENYEEFEIIQIKNNLKDLSRRLGKNYQIQITKIK